MFAWLFVSVCVCCVEGLTQSYAWWSSTSPCFVFSRQSPYIVQVTLKLTI